MLNYKLLNSTNTKECIMTTLKETLRNDLTRNLKAHNELETTTLRLVLGEIQRAEKSGNTAVEFNDDKVLELIASEAKKRRGSAAIWVKEGVVDRAERETAEADFLATYLPVQLTTEAIEELVTNAIAELGTAANVGQVMKLIVPFTKGRADGKLVSTIVKEKLA
jgi:uncharacterized protein YqeY